MAEPRHTGVLQLGRTKQRLFLLVILLVALYVLTPQIGGLSSSWGALRQAKLHYAVAGFAAMMLTYPTAAVTYTVLARHRVSYVRTALVQLSGAFVNRLLPAGIGGMGLNAQYLRRSGHTLHEAVAVVGVNNTSGALASILLVGAVVLGGGISLQELQTPSLGSWWYAVGILMFGLAIYTFMSQRWRQAVWQAVRGVRHTLYGYRLEPERLVMALASSLGLAFLHVLILWCAGQAIDLSLPVSAYIVVFSVGTLVGAASPTPGGLVGMEAGLTAAFVTYGVSPGMGLATALLYRLLTYWLPLLPGFVAFLVVRKRLGL